MCLRATDVLTVVSFSIRTLFSLAVIHVPFDGLRTRRCQVCNSFLNDHVRMQNDIFKMMSTVQHISLFAKGKQHSGFGSSARL